MCVTFQTFANTVNLKRLTYTMVDFFLASFNRKLSALNGSSQKRIIFSVVIAFPIIAQFLLVIE